MEVKPIVQNDDQKTKHANSPIYPKYYIHKGIHQVCKEYAHSQFIFIQYSTPCGITIIKTIAFGTFITQDNQQRSDFLMGFEPSEGKIFDQIRVKAIKKVNEDF